MDFKTFLENFDAIAEAPGGIPKLRSLILDLAVRGKLVPQNPQDKSADSLLEEIKFEKAQFIKNNKLGRDKPVEPITLDDLPFEIPKNWIYSRIGELFVLSSGTTPSRTKQEYFINGTESWVKTTDLNNGIVLRCEEKITKQAVSDCNLKYYPSRTICIAMYGGAGTIGKSGILGIKTTINQSVCGIYPSSYVVPEFLHIYVKSIRPTWMKFAAGLRKDPNINAGIIRNMIFPLPPLAEQKRIVAKVDELMGLCDRYEAAKQTRDKLRQKLRESAIASLMNAETDEELDAPWAFVRNNWQNLSQQPEDVGSLRKTILQLAVRGKLVPQNKDDETLDALLTKAEQYQPKYKPTEKDYIADTINEAYSTFYELPLSWQWVRLRELSSSMTNGLYKPARFYSDKGIASIRMFNIQDGQLLLNHLKRVEVTEEEYSTYQLSWGDIIVNRVNSRELVGKAAIVDVVNEPMVYEAMNIRVKLIPGVTFPHYINLVLLNENSRQLFFNVAKQASGQASISQPQVGSLPIPLPPLAEQKRIVTKVDELMKLCDQLEASLRQSQQRAESLAASAISHLTI